MLIFSNNDNNILKSAEKPLFPYYLLKYYMIIYWTRYLYYMSERKNYIIIILCFVFFCFVLFCFLSVRAREYIFRWPLF